jgi:peptidyl-prolyl cis-trans isomerase-like 4
MAVSGKLGEKSLHGSQFFITTVDDKADFDGKFTVFGRVAEGMDVVNEINTAYTDEKGRPFRNIRIKHVVILEDVFADPPGLIVPPASPRYVPLDHRKEADDKMMHEENEGKTKEQIEEEIAAKEALSRANVLEMVGDIDDADAKPPDEVLFVCKLHPVTQEDDLEIIFGRFGAIKKVEIIKDRRTGDSLCYGFVEFETKESCVEAYTKMDNVLIDEKRIHVDFCQSVSKIWNNRIFGVPLPDEALKKGKASKSSHSNQRRRSRSREKKNHRRRSRSPDRRRRRSRSRESKRKRSRSRSRSRDRRRRSPRPRSRSRDRERRRDRRSRSRERERYRK